MFNIPSASHALPWAQLVHRPGAVRMGDLRVLDRRDQPDIASQGWSTDLLGEAVLARTRLLLTNAVLGVVEPMMNGMRPASVRDALGCEDG